VHEALVHGRVWHLTAIYFTFSVSMYTMVFWMPLLLKALASQYSNTGVGILVMIPYLVALAAMLVVAHSSDLTLERRYHAAIPAIIAAVFLLSLATTVISSAFLAVVLWCFVGAGIFSLYGPFWALPNEFLSGSSAAAGIALINSIGNLGGFIGPLSMGAINRRTGSFRGGFLLASISLVVSATLILMLRNRIRRDAILSPVIDPVQS